MRAWASETLALRLREAAVSGLVLSDDLIFTSRITGTARSLGLSIRTANSLDALRQRVVVEAPSCVIIDLHHPGLDVAELLAYLRENCPAMPRVVGYGSHVDAPRLKAAREAGCDVVLPRSAFVEQLLTDLPAWLTPRTTQ
jgi:CheY-like chemotaxis protein